MSLQIQLQSIWDKNGRLDPGLVVKTARPEKHPLHGRFEWDNEIAGEAHRRRQAHELIQSVRIVYRVADKEEMSVRAFHAVRRPDSVTPSYEPVGRVIDDPFMLQLILSDMERDILTMKKRYGNFEEFRQLVQKHLAV